MNTNTVEYWKERATFFAAMVALIPVQDRQEPTEDDLSLAHDIFAQYSPKEKLYRFQITFWGRARWSFEPIRIQFETVDAPDIVSAVSKLYEKYENVRVITHNNGNAPEI